MATTDQQHTPEPWSVGHDKSSIVRDRPDRPYSFTLAETLGYKGEREANASRIATCVNACAGINPGAVPAMLEALRLAAIQLDRAADSLVDCGSKDLAEDCADRAMECRKAITEATKHT